jgi:hypothetical protein
MSHGGKEDLISLARYIYTTIIDGRAEGDLTKPLEIMAKYNLIDENNEWIYEEEDK